MAVVDDVRPLGSELERSYEVHVRNRLKFRVGQIVYVAFSLDETVIEFAFPKEERAALALSSAQLSSGSAPSSARSAIHVARAKVTQRFLNPHRDWYEGIYVFPLPENAAVDRLRMKIGERMVEKGVTWTVGRLFHRDREV